MAVTARQVVREGTFKQYGSYDDQEFWAQVRSDTPALLAFWDHTCAPCKVMAPVFERLSKRYRKRLEFIAVNVYDRPDISKQFGVTSTPTFMVVRGGKALRRVRGVVHERVLAEEIEAFALPAPAEGPAEERRGLFGLFRRG